MLDILMFDMIRMSIKYFFSIDSANIINSIEQCLLNKGESFSNSGILKLKDIVIL